MNGCYQYWSSRPDGMLFHHLFERPLTSDPNKLQADLYSFIAAKAHEFSFSFAYIEALISEYLRRGYEGLSVPTGLTFLEILEFRLDEINRVAEGGNPEWQWPSSWTEKPSWNSHVLHEVNDDSHSITKDDRIQIARGQTEIAIRVQKELLGHGQPVFLDHHFEQRRISRLADDFIAAGFSLKGDALPNMYVSLTRPTISKCKGNEEKAHWDVDGILGSYNPEKKQIVIYDRAVSVCANDLTIPKKDLMQIVLLHELAHFWIHNMACPSFPEGWSTEYYTQTDSAFHEAYAQFATYCHFGRTKDHYQTTFEKLLTNQSALYHEFQRLLNRNNDTKKIWSELLNARKQTKPPRLDVWINAI